MSLIENALIFAHAILVFSFPRRQGRAREESAKGLLKGLNDIFV